MGLFIHEEAPIVTRKIYNTTTIITFARGLREQKPEGPTPTARRYAEPSSGADSQEYLAQGDRSTSRLPDIKLVGTAARSMATEEAI
ncbi:MAG: hypothetical protein HY924_15665 [Elusimicrobia bacterium]|nr:hypothetical protein [Elusimicrobiota bacterium]